MAFPPPISVPPILRDHSLSAQHVQILQLALVQLPFCGWDHERVQRPAEVVRQQVGAGPGHELLVRGAEPGNADQVPLGSQEVFSHKVFGGVGGGGGRGGSLCGGRHWGLLHCVLAALLALLCRRPRCGEVLWCEAFALQQLFEGLVHGHEAGLVWDRGRNGDAMSLSVARYVGKV